MSPRLQLHLLYLKNRLNRKMLKHLMSPQLQLNLLYLKNLNYLK